MLFVFGIRSKFLKSIPLMGKICNYCKQGNLFLQFYQKYFHLMWIPFFPTSKIYYSICSHCKQALGKSEMDAQTRELAENEKRQVKTPLWTFIFLFLMAIPVVIAIVMMIIGAIVGGK